MKLFKKAKDGGPESHVTGFWLIEWKKLFSIVLLRFSDGSRDAYHSHAFNALSWIFKGKLLEYAPNERLIGYYTPSLIPVYTSRKRFHKVISHGNTWVLSFRGPWSKTWEEYIPSTNQSLTLTNGREVVTNR